MDNEWRFTKELSDTEYNSYYNNDNTFSEADVRANDVLQWYVNICRQQDKEACTFGIPIHAFQFLHTLYGLAGNRGYLIAADHGTSSINWIYTAENPYIDYHHTISVGVNFHSILLWSSLNGGGGIRSDEEDTYLSIIAAYPSFDQRDNNGIDDTKLEIDYPRIDVASFHFNHSIQEFKNQMHSLTPNAWHYMVNIQVNFDANILLISI